MNYFDSSIWKLAEEILQDPELLNEFVQSLDIPESNEREVGMAENISSSHDHSKQQSPQEGPGLADCSIPEPHQELSNDKNDLGEGDMKTMLLKDGEKENNNA